MNNYYNYQDYMKQAKQNVDYMNIPAQPNPYPVLPIPSLPSSNPVPMPNPGSGKTYEPYQGFIRGNLFPTLYDPYKINTPYEIKPMNEQANMLTGIDSLGFAMIDLNLYLDLHPDDKKMIDVYNQYRIQKDELMKQYQNRFGPLLTNSDALKSYPWAWNQTPWPWENK